MSARVSEAVAIRDDEAGIELRVSAAAPSKEGGVSVTVHALVTLEPGDIVTLKLSAEIARELRVGITRALKASGAGS